MMNSTTARIILWALVLVGFFGAAKISYTNLTGNACPYIGFIPVCYLVLAGYGLMILSLLIPHIGCKHYFFCAGWGTAFLIALVGSVAEIAAGGGVCPSTGGQGIRGASSASIGSVPMCFISLAMLIVILVLFLLGPYKRACELQK